MAEPFRFVLFWLKRFSCTHFEKISLPPARARLCVYYQWVSVGGGSPCTQTACCVWQESLRFSLQARRLMLLLQNNSLGALACAVRLWVNLASRMLPLPGRDDEASR